MSEKVFYYICALYWRGYGIYNLQYCFFNVAWLSNVEILEIQIHCLNFLALSSLAIVKIQCLSKQTAQAPWYEINLGVFTTAYHRLKKQLFSWLLLCEYLDKFISLQTLEFVPRSFMLLPCECTVCNFEVYKVTTFFFIFLETSRCSVYDILSWISLGLKRSYSNY